ncbi:hypothetical protein [Streptomyces sp. SID9124]|uniref:hypothetical protein n=1 Tax=Streptomyces sp. SID9124 TaxID=2706108 RepID=UPI0013E08105|nr:hypothetical protein [Streptomyces sp. SID9124]NED11344.1 hypothetical protein [Streptomyces sp. SID9124]
MQKIADPAGEGVVVWLTRREGGRQSGPPTAPVYMATAVFVQGSEEEVRPGWSASADQLSILLQETERLDEGHRRCLVGFLVPELAAPHMRPGAELVVLEGPRTVARLRIGTVRGPGGGPSV